MRASVASVAGVALFVLPALVPAQSDVQTVDIREWPVPWEDSRPRDPFADAQGRVWFVGQVGNYVAFLDPTSGEFKRFEIEEGTNPHNLIVDERGVWYAGNRNARIGKLDPATGRITTYPMPDPAARDPHTLVFARNGDIWFTVQGGNFIGRLEPESGTVRLVKSPVNGSRPYGIKMDAQDHPWVVLFGTNKIATVDPASLELRIIDLPRPESRPRRIAITKDQSVWYVDYAGGKLGRLDPASGEIREWDSPGGAQSRPYAMEIDDRDRIWYVETGVQPNRFIGFHPGTETFVSATPVPSGAGAVRHMVFDANRRVIWFGTDTNNIGRVIIP